MPLIKFFIHPKTLFELIEAEVRHDSRIRVIFRRFQPTERDPPAEFRVMEPKEDLTTIYCGEGYREIYLTLGALPRGRRDWNFRDHAANELIELWGGRLKGNQLEMGELRTGLKKSPALWLYTRLQRAIAKRCKKGITLGRNVYPRDYYDPEIVGLDLVGSVDKEAGHYLPLHTAQHRRAS